MVAEALASGTTDSRASSNFLLQTLTGGMWGRGEPHFDDLTSRAVRKSRKTTLLTAEGQQQVNIQDCTHHFLGGGKKQTRHHLSTGCRAWAPQIRTLWRDIGKAQGWRHPRAPSVRWLWGEKSTGAVLDFLGSTRVGCIRARRVVPEEAARAVLGDEGEEGGPGPPVV